MKRLSLVGAWPRLAIQGGLLVGMALAFVGGSQLPRLGAAPPPGCVQDEGLCAFQRPMFLIDLDYSTSMNADFGQLTRWQHAVAAVKSMISADNGFLTTYFMLGLMRFGHDPDPVGQGTPIPNDSSGLSDGQKLDVGFYDEVSKDWYACEAGDMIAAALDALPAPLNGNPNGIHSWTRGSLEFAADTIAKARADHPEDLDQRPAAILVLTDGEWTNPLGNLKLAPASANPAITAADLYDNHNTSTFVVAIGEAEGLPFTDELAAAGGTGAAVDAADPQALVDGLQMVTSYLADALLAPICGPDVPRVMVLLDASSSMLNLQAGLVRAKQGQGGWEQARDALAGADSIFDVVVQSGKIEELTHLGLSVFGGNMPDESDVLVQYGPCRKPNFAWALDPANSCSAPGCVDPYADAPITWTFQDGSLVPPMFADTTLSHMPTCNPGTNPNKGCFGSGTFTHLGLLTIQSNIAAYKAQCMLPDTDAPCDADTQFVNILITDGQTNSTQAQYEPPLLEMFNAGITTHIIGFGDGVDSPMAIAIMQSMADLGSGNALDYYDAQNQAALEAALAEIFETLLFDECCPSGQCDSGNGDEFGDDEPDPIPEPDVLPGSTGTTDESTSDPIDSTSTSTASEASSTTADTTLPDPTTTGDPTNPPTTGTPDSSTTAPPPTAPGPDPTGSSEGDTSSASSSEGPAVETDPGGCTCTFADPGAPARHLAVTLLALGLAAASRRRRR